MPLLLYATMMPRLQMLADITRHFDHYYAIILTLLRCHAAYAAFDESAVTFACRLYDVIIDAVYAMLLRYFVAMPEFSRAIMQCAQRAR